ncbi:hypothetical protein E2P81_ATG08445 [Venturia nashicola]|uniref:Uncharacterized protein n=1 Tax=Venturia nashicola TaxID=86259 RepID=A0A4Z1NUR1_9PEZI|nr:hypothetical protein E6O75_ATG08637 [Venturia nashicola]TLD20781.1 hypothetical protein E2P81_ATG08445 [Venturia nashicola]
MSNTDSSMMSNTDSSMMSNTDSSKLGRKKRQHFIITPVDCPERPWKTPTFKYKEENGREPQGAPMGVFEADLLPDIAADAYFVHHPYISFCSPPRAFRRGETKNSPKLALINNSWFWRKWKLQFGERLADDRVIDRRGVVSLSCGSVKACTGEKAVKGCKVRKWGLWGETGKRYHNAGRQGEDKENRKLNADHMQGRSSTKRSNSPGTLPSHAVLARDYHFQQGGIDFYWKGTGTVKEGRICGACLHFNHLKLMARLPFTVTNIV